MIGNEHPDAFAGPLDNWHIHYNLCRGNAEGRDTFVPRSECEAAGGNSLFCTLHPDMVATVTVD